MHISCLVYQKLFKQQGKEESSSSLAYYLSNVCTKASKMWPILIFFFRNIALSNIDTWSVLHPGISSVVGEVYEVVYQTWFLVLAEI